MARQIKPCRSSSHVVSEREIDMVIDEPPKLTKNALPSAQGALAPLFVWALALWLLN
ncbi:MAG: hypothetical protein KA740_04395 [Rhodoferax sp.]|jgi:hypothetical protein|nr:hypothetical protein [Rhodoferax sp.]